MDGRPREPGTVRDLREGAKGAAAQGVEAVKAGGDIGSIGRARSKSKILRPTRQSPPWAIPPRLLV